ncbi:MAG: hypothetical protein ACRDVG_12460, partial [Jatrophihabitantaceae bacterium]
MKTIDTPSSLDNPASVTALLTGLLAGGSRPTPTPPLTYLRRKAGRGLVAVYGSARTPGEVYTVSVPESAFSDPGAAMDEPHWQGEWPGLVSEPNLGLAVQAFPVDRSLPALARAVDPATSPELWSALQTSGSVGLPAGAAWTLRGAEVEPVRYKPGDRCVLRYRLDFRRPGPGGQAGASVIGKLYREPEQAAAAHALLVRLNGSSGRGWCPAPLTLVESLALLLSEDLGDHRGVPPTRVGTDVVRGGNALAAPTIIAAARSLAELQTGDADEAGT